MAKQLEITIRLTSGELSAAIERFEKINGKVEDSGSFVLALVNFSHEILSDPDAFYGEDDRTAKILQLIGEDAIPRYLQDAYDAVEDRLHDIQLDDEIWDLVSVIVRTVVAADDQLLTHGILTTTNSKEPNNV